MNSPFGKPIVTNAAMQVLLKQAPSAIDSLKKTFDLTEGEKYLLLNAGVGQGVFFAGRKHVAIQIVASPKEHEIVTTNPEELARRQAQREADATKSEEVKSEDTKIEENIEKTNEQESKDSEVTKDTKEPTSFEAPPEDSETS